MITCAKDNYGWNDTPYLNNFIRSYIPTVSNVDKRLATSAALTKVWREEVDRIGWYIYSQDPNCISLGDWYGFTRPACSERSLPLFKMYPVILISSASG